MEPLVEGESPEDTETTTSEDIASTGPADATSGPPDDPGTTGAGSPEDAPDDRRRADGELLE